MKRIYLLMLLNIISLYSNAQDVNLSNYPYFDAEPTVAINPVNPNNVIVAWMKATSPGQISIAYAYTLNQGNTWSSPALLPHHSSSFTSADVSLQFNTAGTAFICYIDYKSALDSGFVMVSKSINQGQTWSNPVNVIGAHETSDLPIDRPWIAIDNSSGIYSGRIYVTSKSYYAGPLPHYIWLKSSSDGGLTWTSIKQLDDSIPTDLVTNSMAVPTVGVDGNLYIAYASYHPAQSVYARMICTKSTDGGAHFNPLVAFLFASNSAVNDTLYHPSYVLSANPQDSSNVILSCVDARNGDPDILCFYSKDAGISWNTTPVRVNDDNIGNGAGQDMVWGGFNPQNKQYFAAWRDRRNTGLTSTSNFEIYQAGSQSEGVAFCPSFKLSQTPSSPYIGIRRGNDFMGLALGQNFMYAVWGDSRTGNIEIFGASTSDAIPGACGDDVRENAIEDLSLNLYPNPNNGTLNIKLNMSQPANLSLSIFDINGKLVKQVPTVSTINGQNELTLDVSKLTAGHYLLRLTGKGVRGQTGFEKQ